MTLRYAHEFRKGLKDSTEWGDSNLTGGFGTRSIVPTFYNIDEKRDIFQGDVNPTWRIRPAVELFLRRKWLVG